MKNIRILFMLPSLRLAGAERQTVDLANGLAKAGYGVHLFSFERDLGLKGTLDCNRVKFHHYPRSFKYDFSNISRISEIIDREMIDIVHCTLQIALLFGFFGTLHSRRKPKLIDAIHTTINRDTKGDLFDRLLYVPIMGRCDRIIAVCDSQKSHWESKYPHLADRMVTIHNGIDADYFTNNQDEKTKASLRRELGISDEELVVGMVAGFRPEKNHEEVFTAFSCLVKRGLPIKLLLVGDGERRMILQNKAKELAINDRVIWAGLTNEAKKYIGIFDVGVLFSYAVETFSMAILEMLSMGKPVVAADISGTGEMIFDNSNGYLVPLRDVDMLANRLGLLLDDQQLREAFGVAARRTVLANFTKDVMVKKTTKVLEEVHAG